MALLTCAVAFAANCWVWGVPYRTERSAPHTGRLLVIKVAIGMCVLAASILFVLKDSAQLQQYLVPVRSFATLVIAIVALFSVLLPPQHDL